MPLSHDEMVALIRRLESLPASRRASYRRRLALLAALGYAYVLFLLLLALGALTGLVIVSVKWGRFSGLHLHVGIALLVFAGIVVRALWVRAERPDGIELQRGDAPRLFEEVGELCAAVRAPTLNHIYLVPDHNAAVAQLPRLGLLGWQDSYLLAGLLLMQTTTREQFRAVLAHEIGHLSENHGRFGAWIWRVDATWGRLTEELAERRHRGAFLINWFANWYAPYFHAYAFVLMRENERKADEYTGQIAGAEASARELAAGAVWGEFFEREFWPRVFDQVTDRSEPPAGTSTGMMEELRRPVTPEKADEWFLAALAVKTGYDDTHPSLAERLAAIGYRDLETDAAARGALLPGELETTAAAHYLGTRVGDYAARFDSQWQEGMRQDWSERHTAVQQAKERLAELARRQAERPLSQDEAWERAHLTTEFGKTAEAVPLLREIVESRPDFVPARFALGHLLLEDDDEAGVSLVEQAVARDAELLMPGCEALYAFCRRRGRQADAEAYMSRAMGKYDALAKLDEQKTTYTKADFFLPPELPEEYIDRMRELLRGIPEVTEGYLVRKKIVGEIETEVYVFGIVPRFRGFVDEGKAVERLLEKAQLPVELPVEIMVVAVYGGYAFLRKKMRKVEGSLIYQRQG